MCLTIPAKIIEVTPDSVTVEDADGKKELDTPLTPGLDVGDWVLYINRLVIRKIEPEDAQEILDLLKSGKAIDTSLLPSRFHQAVEAIHSESYGIDDLVYLLGTDTEEKEALLREADTVRRGYLKDFICIHGIIEFSNHCIRDCQYCGLRSENISVERYRMESSEIIDAAKDAVKIKGYKLLVLQSGEDPFYTATMMAEIVKSIKKDCRVFIFISVGERGYEFYEELKAAGASGVLLRFESSNEDLFNKIHPNGKNFKERFEHLSFLKELGYYIATGSLTGLPGQALEDIALDILVTKKWANMVSTGPFIPCPDTPLSASAHGDTEMQLKVNAVLRLVMKSSRIPVVTALETQSGEEGRRRALRSGANSLMINLTPEKYRALYSIYPDKFHDDKSVFVKYGLYKYEESFSMLEERMQEEISGSDDG
jgi:biotin synthase